MEKIPLSDRFVHDDKFLNTLAEVYRLQEAIIGTTELAVLSTNEAGIITSFNKAAENLLEYRADEVVGKETTAIFYDQTEILRRADELAKNPANRITSIFQVLTHGLTDEKTADHGEWIFISKSGRRFPVALSVTVLKDENDMTFGYAFIATDITTQKATEQKIRESEAHLQAILTSMDDSTFEIDEEGRYVNIWSNHAEIAGVPLEDMRNKTFGDIFGKDAAKTFDKLRMRVLETGIPKTVEFKAHDNERWYSIKYSRITDENGKTNRISSSVSDITERKKAEQALIESEKKFRSLAENVPCAIFLSRNDATYSKLYLNNQVEDITGFTADQFIRGEVNMVQLIHPEDAPMVFDIVNRALKEKTSFDLEYRLRHRTAQWKWVKERGIGLYNGDQLLMLEGVITDITEQKLAREEYEKVANENYSLFNNAVNLNAIIGFDGYFKRLNPTWTNMLGWTLEEMSTMTVIHLVHPEDADRTQAAIAFIIAGNDLYTYEMRCRCKDGTYRWLLCSASSEPKAKLIYATAVDITERKKSEEQLLMSKKDLELLAIKLQAQNRQLDEFAHIISHNLRSPIGNIKALINLLNGQSTLDDYKLIFEKLKNVSINLGETMNELMDTLKVKKEAVVERVDIQFKVLLDKVIQSLEGELIRSGASVTFDFAKAPVISYSKPYLESIFLNLLSNAIKYRSPDRKPAVHFETSVKGNQIELKVVDNGLGIDMEKYGDKLFGLHKTFHDNKEARGVGLFLIKTQVEALGGSIHAESTVGKGTTFIVTF